ncbi:LuxR family transcriptional regulator [Aestuariimicrobium sp. T2.26MG-19.2B]|uniref:LuxR family transcriptional regulator n=1 Tax=Aestuariimicrobium sp. T2.26MG-19.2B TaxID=3040679 RepID=UPI002477AEEB|nr:LuxR family transcriptional regulator [Aestuariimicrobium sp. T2.26MG-19.2B]CAI9408557.1 HTH-type transcriptional regulator MalT [Aestuariimicrobium sp. T2.26MG-19.2B]
MGSRAGAEDSADQHLRAGRWGAARDCFLRQLAERPDGGAYEGLAQALRWLDDGAGCLAARESAYRLYRDQADDLGAARAATSLGYDSLLFGEGEAVARGWRGLAHGLLDRLPETVEQGWLAVREAEAVIAAQGDPPFAQAWAEQAAAVGVRQQDADLSHAATALAGLALTLAGCPEEGAPLLDRAVTAATTGEVRDAMWMGKIYCWLIIACQQTRDLSRADEWCRRVETVCERRQLSPLFTACRIQHSSVLIERGTWSQAETNLTEVMDEAVPSRRHSRLDAVVLLGELRRRQGRIREAEELLRQAEFEPGAIVSQAMIRLSRGERMQAWTAISGVLAGIPEHQRTVRASFLLPAVQTALAAGDEEAARNCADELRTTAGLVGNGPLQGLAAAADATLAVGSEAVAQWHTAVRWFHESRLPFDEGESRLALATALLALGDEGGAGEQVGRAIELLEGLGARERLDDAIRLRGQLSGRHETRPVLTEREVEILRCVAQGMTNQQIAQTLTVSPHTVHRHLSHILGKLEQPTRAGAVAHALSHHLL